MTDTLGTPVMPGSEIRESDQMSGVIRSTFVIDPKGKVQHAMYGVKATGHVERLLRELEVSSQPTPRVAAATVSAAREWRNWQTRQT